MVTYVLDTSAILRFFDNEAGASRVEAMLGDCFDDKCRVVVSAVNWGEVATKLFKKQRNSGYQTTLHELKSLGVEVLDATEERSVRSGLIKAQKKIPYADAFGIELAMSIPNSMLVTGDFDAKPAENEIKIEFLPRK